MSIQTLKKHISIYQIPNHSGNGKLKSGTKFKKGVFLLLILNFYLFFAIKGMKI